MTFKQNIFYINGITFKYHKEKKYVKYDFIKNFISNLKVMNSDIKKSDIYDSKTIPLFIIQLFMIYTFTLIKKTKLVFFILWKEFGLLMVKL